MRSKPGRSLVLSVATLCVTAALALAADQPAKQLSTGQLPTAEIVSVGGATTTFQVRDMDGQLVEVAVPSQSLADIRISGTPPTGVSSTAGQTAQTVAATVVAVDTLSNEVKVQTQANQTLVLAMSPAILANMQIGEQLTLVVPW